MASNKYDNRIVKQNDVKLAITEVTIVDAIKTSINTCSTTESHTRMVVRECFKGDEASQ